MFNFANDWTRTGTSGVGSERSTNWATTTAPIVHLLSFKELLIFKNRNPLIELTVIDRSKNLCQSYFIFCAKYKNYFSKKFSTKMDRRPLLKVCLPKASTGPLEAAWGLRPPEILSKLFVIDWPLLTVDTFWSNFLHILKPFLKHFCIQLLTLYFLRPGPLRSWTSTRCTLHSSSSDEALNWGKVFITA